MDIGSRYFDVISGRRKSLGANVLRAGLSALSVPYAAGIRARNFYFGRWALPAWLEVPVISVGNITTGGTGKTPMTIWLCEKLLERGRKPAVLSRGYKAHEGLSDELMLISRRVSQAVAVANPNRFAAGQLAIEQYGVQAAVLDDGFQHRRMGRDLDIVLIDATQPFGFDHLLPRGLLREPIRNLSRAEAFVITRSDQADATAIESIRRQLEQINPDAPVAMAKHEPRGFRDLHGVASALPREARIGAFAGIARPEAFVRTLESLGHSPVSVQWFPDHHAFAPPEVEALAKWAKWERLDALVTTEKDAVKLEKAPIGGPVSECAFYTFEWPVPLHVLGINMCLLEDGDKILGDLIDTMLKEHEEP